MRGRIRILAALIVTALVSGAAWSGYRYIERHAASQTASQSGTPAPATVGPETLVFFRVDEPSGRVDMIGETAATLNLSGDTPAEVASAYPGWQVKEAKASEVVLVPSAGGQPFSVGLRGGFVAIYVGTPVQGVVDQVTGIAAKGLLPADRSRLAGGIPVASLTEAWRLLEGLSTG